jgi:hypothetical protein
LREVPFEIGVTDLHEIAMIERIDAGLNLRAQRFQSEAVFLPALLEYAQRIANRLAPRRSRAGRRTLKMKGLSRAR